MRMEKKILENDASYGEIVQRKSILGGNKDKNNKRKDTWRCGLGEDI